MPKARVLQARTYAYFGATMRNGIQVVSPRQKVQRGSRWRRFAVCVAIIAVATAGAIAMIDQLLLGRPGDQFAASTAEQVAVSSHAVLNDEWLERISRESNWRSNRAAPGAPAGNNLRNKPSRLQGPPEQPSWFIAPPPNVLAPQPFPRFGVDPDSSYSRGSSSSRSVSGYRTVCVRTCDGFFFPISSGVSEASFSRDQATCTNACPGARLFHYRLDSQEPEDMVDQSGQKYSRMKNADLFRTQYVESCKCKPHPWEQEAVDRHRIYALEDQRRKGNRAVVAELDQLKSKNRLENKSSSRRRPGDRRRPGADDDATAAAAGTPVAQLPAPRSDASRGQTTPAIMTGSLTEAASAATIESVTNSANAGTAPPSEPRNTPSVVPAVASGGSPSRATPDVQALPGSSLSGGIIIAPGEQPALAPEPTAVPIPEILPEPAVKPKAERQRRSKSASRSGGEMRLGAGQRPSGAGQARRSADWTRSVFSQ